jgi:hypothetical protein
MRIVPVPRKRMEPAPMVTLLSDSRPLPCASKTPVLTPGVVTWPCLDERAAAGTRSVPSSSISVLS